MTRGYMKIIEKLESIEGLPDDQAAAVAEACDIIHDYEAACCQAARMAEKYETPAAAIRRDDLGYCCPDCGRWIRVPDAWCHWCGKKIKWQQDAHEMKRRMQDNEQSRERNKTERNGRGDPGVLRPRRRR